jgi:hypothetical protein
MIAVYWNLYVRLPMAFACFPPIIKCVLNYSVVIHVYHQTEHWRQDFSIMAGTFRKLKSFEKEKKSWEHYCERLCHYFDANDIGNTEAVDLAKRQSILLSVCGSKIYKHSDHSELLAPDKPGTKSFYGISDHC